MNHGVLSHFIVKLECTILAQRWDRILEFILHIIQLGFHLSLKSSVKHSFANEIDCILGGNLHNVYDLLEPELFELVIMIDITLTELYLQVLNLRLQDAIRSGQHVHGHHC